jgi:transposase
MNNDERQAYGWGKRGERVFDEKPGFASERISIIAGLNTNNLCAPFVFDGYCDRDVIESYFEFILLPEIGPGKTIILDNASFHKGGNIEQIVKKASCDIIYLPAYSPDFNPIEHHWSAVKSSIRSILPATDYDIWDAAIIALRK